MWRWQPSVRYNQFTPYFSMRRIFFLRLMGLVFAAHILILLGYSFATWLLMGRERFQISLANQAVTYVLMPLHKKIDQTSQKITKDSGSSNLDQKSKVIDHETYLNKKNSAKKSKKSLAALAKTAAKKEQATQTQAKAQSVAKEIPQQASVVLKSSSDTRKSLKKKSKAAQKKKKQKLSAKKSKKKIKKVMTKIQEVAQPEVVAAVTQPQVVKPQEQKAEIAPVEQSVPQEVKSEDTVQDSVSSSLDQDFDANNVIFIGYEQFDQSLIGSKIQHAIQQQWTPPVGMSDDMACELLVKIDDQGSAQQVKITKSSGGYVYDVAARKALLAIEYPQEVFNKTITIVLGAS